MRDARGVIGWGLAPGLALLLAIGLLLWPVGQSSAQESATWEALGPEGQEINRLFTPTSGALLARSKEALVRSDDGGMSWRTIQRPADTTAVTVSPNDHQLLFAAGAGGVFQSEDGGENWNHVSEQGDNWSMLEVSGADPTTLYGVAITNPPADNGSNRWHEFRVSHDSGATWETVRTQRERIVAGSQPCGYTVNLLVPDAVSITRVLTIEGCTGRGEDPLSGRSADEGRTVHLFPDLRPEQLAANSAVGGAGVNPDRWYVSLFRPGIAYTRFRQSKVMRTDDGVNWTTVYEADGGSPGSGTAKPVDFVSSLAYNPRHPDDLFAVMRHFEPGAERGAEHKLAGFNVRGSRDGGMSWNELGRPDAPSVSQLAVGVDGRYLFAATPKGVFRAALP